MLDAGAWIPACAGMTMHGFVTPAYAGVHDSPPSRTRLLKQLLRTSKNKRISLHKNYVL
jgi:hypothetical protein